MAEYIIEELYRKRNRKDCMTGLIRGELIRCKDCKYYLQLEDDIGECRLTDSFFTCEISINDYCSRGERKEETE